MFCLMGKPWHSCVVCLIHNIPGMLAHAALKDVSLYHWCSHSYMECSFLQTLQVALLYFIYTSYFFMKWSHILACCYLSWVVFARQGCNGKWYAIELFITSIAGQIAPVAQGFTVCQLYFSCHLQSFHFVLQIKHASEHLWSLPALRILLDSLLALFMQIREKGK